MTPAILYQALRGRLTGAPFLRGITVSPPASASLDSFRSRLRPFREHVDFVQLTDNPRGIPHVASIAAAAALVSDGFAVIPNITCRDRNLIGQQSTLLGAAAAGCPAVFCLAGDPPALGDHPGATAVTDLTSQELVALAATLRDRGTLASGRPLEVAPQFAVGAALSADGEGRLEEKAGWGADFFITQPVFGDHLGGGARPRPRIIAGLMAVRSRAQLDEALALPGVRVTGQDLTFLAAFAECSRAAQNAHCANLLRRWEARGELAGSTIYLGGFTDEEALELTRITR